ncbi:MAG TPA: single-stranded-DNA-specific exonuclease RecJ [Bacteroidetes bacterium]|nr:single-stranded-DNA-specific exonuclease RecJ [Bacteroidota bacterium]HRK04803.1 single-stranded-DNA-specific exonuclease RecJ [Chlorobiota bacterium]
MNYRWVFKETLDEHAVNRLNHELHIPQAIARVLVGRGMTSVDDVVHFFEPDLGALHDPFLMDDMEAAVERIERALDQQELIWIHGDYDVDGTSSTAMMLHFLKELGARADYHIPSRMDEGFGFTPLSVERAREAGATIIITVDVGITAVKAVERATELGIDVIICDHHQAAEGLPEAAAVLDPIKPGCDYPFKDLAACGVAFKLLQALSLRRGRPELALTYLDFVAIASAADIAPLSGENRILSHFGLLYLNSKPRPGLKGLIDCAGLTVGQINNSSIIFGLAPRINAAGRLGDPRRAVEMMVQEDEIIAFRIAQELEHDNRLRRAIDEETFEEAEHEAAAILSNGNVRSLVLHRQGWHAGVIGIVASRLVERFHLPSIMLTSIDGIAKGSARSIKDFDIHSALKQCEDLLIEYGGHKHAAGLSLREEHIAELRFRLDEIARDHLTKDEIMAEIAIDTELSLNELSPSFFKYLSKFAPYGYSNHRPVFFSRNVVSANGVKIVGNNHLKFRAIQKNFAIDAIGFNLGHKINECSHGKPFSVVYTLEENLFNGTTTPQLRIKDIRPE